MPRRPYLIGAVAGASLLSGCGFGAVDMDQHDLEPGSEQVCAELIAALPDTVDDAVHRDVEPSSDSLAAWGEPPIVLRCGVPLPSSYRPDTRLHDIDGVGWLAEPGQGGSFFTAADREVLVEVAVPDDYAPEADVLVDLAAVILDTVPERSLR